MNKKLDRGKKRLTKAAKRESRVALAKKSPWLGLIFVFVLRGVKGLEKAFVVESEEEVLEILKKFSAIYLEVGQVRSSVNSLPQPFRSTVTTYADLLERLSSEIASLIG